MRDTPFLTYEQYKAIYTMPDKPTQFDALLLSLLGAGWSVTCRVDFLPASVMYKATVRIDHRSDRHFETRQRGDTSGHALYNAVAMAYEYAAELERREKANEDQDR